MTIKCSVYHQCGNEILLDKQGRPAVATGGMAWGRIDIGGSDWPDGRYVTICPGHQNRRTVDWLLERSDDLPVYTGKVHDSHDPDSYPLKRPTGSVR